MPFFCYTFKKCGRPTYTAKGGVGAGVGAGTRQAWARPAEAALGHLWAAGGSAQPPPGSGSSGPSDGSVALRSAAPTGASECGGCGGGSGSDARDARGRAAAAGALRDAHSGTCGSIRASQWW